MSVANSRYLPQLVDAVNRYHDEPNFATESAVFTACAAVWDVQWACDALDNDPAWQLADPNWCNR